MSTNFLLGRDQAGFNAFALSDSINKYSALLTLGVPDSVTIPNRYKEYMAVFAFEPGAAVWIAINAAATVPAGAFAVTQSEMNPTIRKLKGGDIISFITGDTTALAGVILYALQ